LLRGRVASFISLAQNVGGEGATFFVQLFPIGPLPSLNASLFGVSARSASPGL